MTPNGMGWIIVDALDTMMLMNLTSELKHARQWIHDSLSYDQDHDVNTFETTIRMLGGLLSAHYLSTEFEGIYAPVDDGYSDDMYIEKATDLADRLLGAYETKSGVPLASVNLHTMQGLESHADAGASSTAEATSLQLEMKYLAKLTGEDNYWDKAERVMKVVDDNNPEDGLVPIFMYADKGTFRGENIRLGSRGDSYYEYLIKQYLQTSEQEPVYQAMWNESLAGMKKHLISYSYPSNFTVIAERPNGLAKAISGKMDHLVCFMPGTIALATTKGLPLAEARAQPNWGPRQDEDMRLAEELMNTCWGMYMATPARLAGEITHFHMHSPPFLYDDFNDHPEKRPHSPLNFDKISPGHDFAGRDDFIIKGGDSHNLQRPETVESLFYMWRITGEERYRNWGWEMFQSFMKWTDVGDGSGYSSLSSVLKTPPPMRDNMESFWLVRRSLGTDLGSKTDSSCRPKRSNTSTCSSPPTTSSHSQTWFSTPRLTRFHDSSSASCSRQAGNVCHETRTERLSPKQIRSLKPQRSWRLRSLWLSMMLRSRIRSRQRLRRMSLLSRRLPLHKRRWMLSAARTKQRDHSTCIRARRAFDGLDQRGVQGWWICIEILLYVTRTLKNSTSSLS